MELSKNFIPSEAEQKWTAIWKDKKYFNSKPDNRKAFTVVIPPPNVTGVLHMGHTLNETVQDILVRRARMSGYNACWVPGSDHASIATEAKVVQMLKEKGIDKNTLTREEFLKYAFEWKEKYGGIIYNQIERLGCSVDWNRVTFTMDDHYYNAVIKVFVDLYNKGLLYRGARMIHWDPAAQTALSDEEVEYKDIQGKLYYVKYKIVDDNSVQEPVAVYLSTKELLARAKSVIHNLLEKIKNDKSNTIEKTVIGNVTEEGAAFLTVLTGEEITTEYKHTIDRSGINHVLNNHSNSNIEDSRGQIAITEQDFELIVDVLNQPDEIIASGLDKQQKETITYTKKFDDGTIIYLEEIRTGRKELMLQTMRKMKGKTGLESSLKNRRAMPSDESESFSHTSETTPVIANIPKIIDFSILGNISGTTGYLTVATSRPETIMGDVALCVNPNDERYIHLKGKKVIVPLVNREIPIIEDDYIDMSFGTGVLKVTPAHDINDYNIGLKHNLEVIDTLNADGTLSEAAQIYVGIDRFVARKKVVEELAQKNLLIKEEEYPTRLGYSQRSGAVVEPRISTQWFLKMQELAKPALDAVLSGEIKIHPGDKFLATYKHWLENVKDWCISRQLWWGQQIPAWYDEEGKCYVAETEEEARKLTAHDSQLTRDNDVLDTWFSSWLWPMEVFNGISSPGNEELKYYYPTSVLITGQDIIFFWVARMVMAGLEYEKTIPFSDVYFTGMVRDKQGRKMSKSLGNSPDLLNLIDTYGADAVRFGIMISSPAGNDLLFDEASLEQGRNFNNKIWNALKLVKMWEEKQVASSGLQVAGFAIDWFENRLNEVKNEVAQLHTQFRLSEGLKTIYSLIWDDFCSWYLEWIKPNFGENIDTETYNKTVYFFEELLQLLHPYMPFITEEMYHLLKEQKEDLCVKQFAEIGETDKNILQQGELLKTIISSIRDVRNKNNVKPKETIELKIQTENKNSYTNILSILQKQINAETIDFTDVSIDNNVVITLEKDKFFVQLNQEIDKDALKNDLLKDLEYQQKFLQSVQNKLSNERFVQNAKPEVVAIERKKQSDAEARIKTIEESLASL
ncbi:valine--tRNA ligase [Arachidicoccus ginsenosidimutans]|uniref:valine--tRNA ligase n=1 Tax=Arachidicoccus sp. BS20 TaxID=1850526 RepID=UPI0007F0B5FC|nr:valine--tRNA ligase [Arachidicoccus sp. BS20]ANI88592.1 valine--tRNA ligase [Arachidicoccus sp. BS20]